MNTEQAKYLTETEQFANLTPEEARFVLANFRDCLSEAAILELEALCEN